MLDVVEIESSLLEKPICKFLRQNLFATVLLNLKCVYVSHPWYLEHVVDWMVHSENVRFVRGWMLGRLRQPLPLRDMEMSVVEERIPLRQHL